MAFAHLHLHTVIQPAGRRLPHRAGVGQSRRAGADRRCHHRPRRACTAQWIFIGRPNGRDIKPIIGCEVYVAPRTRADKVHGLDGEPYHLVLLCENNTGYQNLIKLVSEGWVSTAFTISPGWTETCCGSTARA